MGLFSWLKKDKKPGGDAPVLPQYLYDESETEEVERFISEAFGDYKNVFHELA